MKKLSLTFKLVSKLTFFFHALNFKTKMDHWKMSMQNRQNIPWASVIYNNIKKLAFSEIKIICYHYYHCIQGLYTSMQVQLCVAIDYCVLFFIECKLTLISLTENYCKFFWNVFWTFFWKLKIENLRCFWKESIAIYC